MEYRSEAQAEQNKIIAELDKLLKEVEAIRAGLKTLKLGSNDYLARAKEAIEKQAQLQALQKFSEQRLELKDQRWTEQLYEDILDVVGAIAKQKSLDLVFENAEPELPAPSPNELMLTIRTHSLLYSGGCLDITDEVTDGLNAKD